MWSGLWQAKEMMKDGNKWIVGNRENIKFFKDPWVRGVNQYRVNNVSSTDSDERLISELLAPGARSWDVTKVNSLCSDCDAKCLIITKLLVLHSLMTLTPSIYIPLLYTYCT